MSRLAGKVALVTGAGRRDRASERGEAFPSERERPEDVLRIISPVPGEAG